MHLSVWFGDLVLHEVELSMGGNKLRWWKPLALVVWQQYFILIGRVSISVCYEILLSRVELFGLWDSGVNPGGMLFSSLV